MAKRMEKTQFKKQLIERDYPDMEVITMKRCEWDEIKASRPDIQAYLKENIWLPEPEVAPYLYSTKNVNSNHLLEGIREGRLFGFVKCDVNVPEELREEFEDLPPVFKNVEISRDDIGPTMKEYALQYGEMETPRRSLISSYFGKQLLFSTNLLQWYMNHGIEVSNVTLFVQFRGDYVFEHLPHVVANARRAADDAANLDPENAFALKLVGEMMKLVGNRYTFSHIYLFIFSFCLAVLKVDCGFFYLYVNFMHFC